MHSAFYRFSKQGISENVLNTASPGIFVPLVFETLRSYRVDEKINIFSLEAHLKRLWNSVDILKINILPNPKDRKNFGTQLQNILEKKLLSLSSKIKIPHPEEKNIFPNFKIKINLASVGFEVQISPLESPSKKFYDQGVEVTDTCFERNFPQAKYPSPAYQYFFQKQKLDFFETLFFDRDEFLREGNISNVFAFFDGELWTPKDHILLGITREITLKLAQKLKIPVQQKAISKKRLHSAQEIFLTNSTKEIIPVTQWAHWKNKDFRQTHRLHQAFLENLQDLNFV